MADNYLGETPVYIEESPYANHTAADWAVEYIVRYGSIDGSHHKDWVLDQVARILKGTPMVVRLAQWGPSAQYPEGYREYRFDTGEPSQAYFDTVREAKFDPETNDPEGYEWNVGIAP